MSNSLIKLGKGIMFGTQRYLQGDLDYFLNNYDTFSDDSIDKGYSMDMATLSMLSSNEDKTKLLYNGKEISGTGGGTSFYPITITVKDAGFDFTDKIVSVLKDGVVVKSGTFVDGICEFNFDNIGTYIINCEETNFPITIPYFGQYKQTIYKTAWIEIIDAANIDKANYTSFSEVLAVQSNVNAIKNSQVACDIMKNRILEVLEIIGYADLFYVAANDATTMSTICESQEARIALYNNYSVTEPILANSNVAINVIKTSSRYETIEKTMGARTDNANYVDTLIYNGSAFVLEVQCTGSLAGLNIGVFAQSPQVFSTITVDGLKIVNRFASTVKGARYTANNTTTAIVKLLKI